MPEQTPATMPVSGRGAAAAAAQRRSMFSLTRSSPARAGWRRRTQDSRPRRSRSAGRSHRAVEQQHDPEHADRDPGDERDAVGPPPHGQAAASGRSSKSSRSQSTRSSPRQTSSAPMPMSASTCSRGASPVGGLALRVGDVDAVVGAAEDRASPAPTFDVRSHAHVLGHGTTRVPDADVDVERPSAGRAGRRRAGRRRARRCRAGSPARSSASVAGRYSRSPTPPSTSMSAAATIASGSASTRAGTISQRAPPTKRGRDQRHAGHDRQRRRSCRRRARRDEHGDEAAERPRSRSTARSRAGRPCGPGSPVGVRPPAARHSRTPTTTRNAIGTSTGPAKNTEDRSGRTTRIPSTDRADQVRSAALTEHAGCRRRRARTRAARCRRARRRRRRTSARRTRSGTGSGRRRSSGPGRRRRRRSACRRRSG